MQNGGEVTLKAVALFSGGLDSILAVKLIEEQGIEVIPLHFYTWFTGRRDRNFIAQCQRDYGITPEVVDVREEFLKVLLNPRFGYGQGMNPCIDCKIFFFKKAKELMKDYGARFVISGEVVGQRPMSQRRDTLKLIEKESRLEGLIVRPLSGRLLPPTVPEKEGWIRRELLEDIQGRGRKRQLELAQKFGLKSIPSPAGGCILTDPTFSSRLRQLIEIVEEPSLEEISLLRRGRVFRVDKCLFIVFRDSIPAELKGIWRTEDGRVCGYPMGDTRGIEDVLAGILLRYAKTKKGRVMTPNGAVSASALPPEVVHGYLVGS